MRNIIKQMCVITAVLLLGAAVHADLQLFQSWEGATTVDNQPCVGVLGGWVDTDSDGSGNLSITTGDGVNLTTFVNLESNSGGDERGVAVFGVSDPIDDGEQGVVFFRFRLLAAGRRCYEWFGVHHHNFTSATGDAIGTGDENDVSNVMSLGFLCYRDGTSGPVSIRTILPGDPSEGGSEITTLEAGTTWYDCWFDIDNGTDTFDLYIQPSTNPGGPAPDGPTSDPLLDDAPFHVSETGGLYGMVMHTPDGASDGPRPWDDRSLRSYLDDIYWDGSQGLSSLAANKPDPANGAVDVPVEKVLSWQAPNSPAVSEVQGYDVYMDPNETKVINRDPSVLKSADQLGTSYDPTPDPAFEKTYYWAVDTTVLLTPEVDPNQTPVVQPGKVWSFTTTDPGPEISSDPENVLVSAGENASFTVGAYSPYAAESYQWLKDGIAIGGATSATLNLTNVQISDEGWYSCEVSNVYNSVTYTVESAAASLGIKRKVAHWTLDGLVSGQYADTSGEGHHADPNDPTVFVDGVNPTLTNSGVVIDENGGWAKVGTWDPSEFSGQLTLSLWVKWAGQPATTRYQGLLGKRNVYASDMRWQLEIGNSSTNPTLTFKSNINGVTVPPLPVDEWVQVVVAYDGTTATMYRNGTYENSGTVTLNDGLAANLMIGAVGWDPASTTGPTSLMNGVLDDVQIYNYAVDPVTVAYSFTDIDPLGRQACADPQDPVLAAYDIDGDCEIGLGDLQMLAASWLGGQLVPDVVPRP